MINLPLLLDLLFGQPLGVRPQGIVQQGIFKQSIENKQDKKYPCSGKVGLNEIDNHSIYYRFIYFCLFVYITGVCDVCFWSFA